MLSYKFEDWQLLAAIPLGLLVAILLAKILAFAVSIGSGFVRGPIFPPLFIGGTAGVAVNQAFASVPLGLAFTACSPPSQALLWLRRTDGIDGSGHGPRSVRCKPRPS